MSSKYKVQASNVENKETGLLYYVLVPESVPAGSTLDLSSATQGNPYKWDYKGIVSVSFAWQGGAALWQNFTTINLTNAHLSPQSIGGPPLALALLSPAP
jgi:hypothetical protein